MNPFVPILLCAASCLAQDEHFAAYHDYASLTKTLGELSDKHPDLVSVTPLADTRGGRKVWAVEVGDRKSGDPSKRSAVWILGGLSGDQPSGSEVALALLLRLVEATDEATVKARSEHTFYFIPRVHPDGVERNLGAPAYLRAGTDTPYDDDHDGTADEDPPRDLDGDGVIVSMRRKDPAGEWVPDEVDPRLMRKADKSRGEAGQYVLYPLEGIDTDDDGGIADDDVGGVLLDRNFPIHWQPRPDCAGAGWAACCEPESRAVADFQIAHPNIVAAILYGGPGNVLYHSPAWLEEKEIPGEDVGILHRLADQYGQVTGLTSHRARRDAPPEGRPPGTWLDYIYEAGGVYALVATLWDLPEGEIPDEAKKKAETKDSEGRLDDTLKRDRLWLAWSDAKCQGKGFVAWHAFQHPTLGAIEIGGWRPGFREIPPAAALPALSEKQLPWIVKLAGQFPRLALVDAEAKPLGEGRFSIRVRVSNQGYLPTASWQARKAQEAGPLVVELDPDRKLDKRLSVEMGNRRRTLGPLAGGETSEAFDWVVKVEPAGGAAPLVIRAWSPRGGTSEVQVMTR